jgi:hypothetical protein
MGGLVLSLLVDGWIRVSCAIVGGNGNRWRRTSGDVTGGAELTVDSYSGSLGR